MGKKSRLKKERRENDNLSSISRKVLKQVIRESNPEVFITEDGKATFYNPMKRTMKGEKYSSDEGKAVVQEMVKQYQNFIKQRLNEEKLAKENNINMEEVDKL